MTDWLLALVIVTTFVAYVLTLHYLTAMVSLIVRKVSLELYCGVSPSAMLSPSDAGVRAAGRGPKSSGVLVGGGVLGRQMSVLDAESEQDGLPAPQVPALLDLAEPAASLLRSDGLNDALAILDRSVGEVFPANRMFMRCSKCGAGISRFKGYRHIRTGDPRTFCETCHRALGLPVRAS
jgi:hypothetical protein